MSEPFIGEIRLFGGNFAPRNFAFCQGQLLPIASHSALFSILGVTYGGDGRTTFGLPNLQDRAAMGTGTGSGPGLTPRRLGDRTGTTTATLTEEQLARHTHQMQGSSTITTEDGETNPAGNVPGTDEEEEAQIFHAPTAVTPFASDAVSPSGGGQPHDNVQPHIAMNYIIALEGLYPSRS